MTTVTPPPPGTTFSEEQKEYLAGIMAGIAQRRAFPYVGILPDSGLLTENPAHGGPNLAAPATPPEETIHGTPISEVTKQELWTKDLHGLDAWD
ncbi:MAG: NirA family protein, partial [Verrucomicrobiales bacterium]|nr:NirA family protein [Verrucomicrobiales bacterium]